MIAIVEGALMLDDRILCSPEPSANDTAADVCTFASRIDATRKK